MEANPVGSDKTATKSGDLHDFFKLKGSHHMTSTASGDGVRDVSHVVVVSHFKDTVTCQGKS